MKQNIYDNPEFFTEYSAMQRSQAGLDGAGEWPALRAMLPDLANRRVLDLGCGFGWHCRYAAEQHAEAVVGVDLSQNMLARARQLTNDSRITYRRAAIEEVDFPEESFHVVLSSLVFHYVQNVEHVCQRIYRWLIPGGSFVLSVEHPIFTARAEQDWWYDARGNRCHWPVDHYQQEGMRHTAWLVDDVIKYHRTVATYLNMLLVAGFSITQVCEPTPPETMLQEQPEFRHEGRRPMFFLVSVAKNTGVSCGATPCS